jgi:anthranilate/para-aminobenzoate synthase component I
MRIPALLLFIVLITTRFSCDKNDYEAPDAFPVEGFSLFDQFGNSMGRIGAPDNDWQLRAFTSLNTREQALLLRPSTVGLANTAQATVFFSPYPNPVKNVSSFYVSSSDSSLFRLFVVNPRGDLLFELNEKIRGGKTFQLNVSDRTQFPNRSGLRFYYSFSATGNPNFTVGSGDIKVCDTDLSGNYQTDCFQ